MKKLLLFILAICYLSVSTGATVHLHYCMGKLAGWGLWHGNSEHCSNCGMNKDKAKNAGCCKDEHKLVKLEKDQKPDGATVQLPQLSAVILCPVFSGAVVICIPACTAQYPVNQAPPRWGHPDTYLLNCVFLI